MTNDLDEESAEIRDIYAHYGLAVYLAQCLEHEIVIALLNEHARAKVTGISRADFELRFDIFMEQQFDLTMGGLVNRLRTSRKLPDTFERELTEAKELRNFLAHRYFRERAEDFISKTGRVSMLAELYEAQQLFERLDEELKASTKTLAETAGVVPPEFEKWVVEYIAQADARGHAGYCGTMRE